MLRVAQLVHPTLNLTLEKHHDATLPNKRFLLAIATRSSIIVFAFIVVFSTVNYKTQPIRSTVPNRASKAGTWLGGTSIGSERKPRSRSHANR